MLIFYYGLLLLATLCISDGVATFLVLCLVDFLLLKAIWEDYKPFVSWRKQKYKQLIKLNKLVKKPLLKKWKKASLLKRAYIIVAGLVGFALLILFAHLYLEVFLFNWNTTETTAKEDSSIRNLALAFLGTTSGIGALFGVYLAILRSEENTRQNKIANDQNKIAKSQADTAIEQSKAAIEQNRIANKQREIANEQSRAAHRQAKTAEEGLITDRINKATDGLGKLSDKDGEPVMVVRLGALYALERIAKDSERDHIQIIEILCAYIRTNSPNNIENDKRTRVREDIEEAVNIIGRREGWSQGKSRLQIEQTQGMRLQFYNCYLQGAELEHANLSGANFYNANLQGSWLNGANLSRARFFGLNINGAKLTGAKTNGAYARSGDFSGCETLTQEQINQMFLGVNVKLGKDAKLQKDLIHPQKDSKYDKIYDDEDAFMEAYREWLEETGN